MPTLTKNQETEEKAMRAHLMKVFEYQLTTPEERIEIARKWLAGDNECYMSLAAQRNLLPIALICGALIDVEHPVLVPNGQLCTRSICGFVTIVLQIEVRRLSMSGVTPEITSQIATSILLGVDLPVDNCQIACG
jgi:hypothetical protein